MSEATTCELICRKDTGVLLEQTILPKLTTGLNDVTTQPLHIYLADNKKLSALFDYIIQEDVDFDAPPPAITAIQEDLNTLMVKVYLTGDLAFQAMVLGRERMSGQHCMLCKLSRKEFIEYKDKDKNGIPWMTHDLVEIGMKVCTPEQGGHPISGIKKPPWWPFINMEHVMVPLLHCLIGTGNNVLYRFCDKVNEYIEKLSPAEIKLMHALTNYDIIIAKQYSQETCLINHLKERR
jgi:hypothetical protein